jgi:HEAT repeat protein
MHKKWLSLVIACVGLAAQTGKVIAGVPTPDMDEQTLQAKYHITPNEEGLLGALQHQDPSVRNFAAMRLADKEDKAAIGPILDALAAETIDGVRIVQATSAARLGSTEGFNVLKSMCEDRSWSPTMRMVAAQTMISFLSREDCLSDILEVLRLEPEDDQASLMALNLLTFKRFKHISLSQYDEIRDLTARYLKSQALNLRIAAGMCVRDVGGPWAIPQLRVAIDAEQNEAVRSSLAKDLRSVGQ